MHVLKKKILITGASRGIGAQIANQLLQEGHHVIGIARNFNPKATDNPNFTPVILDLSQLNTLPEALKKLKKAHPDIDSLISNVGKGLFGHLEELSFQQMRELIDLNFLSHCFLAKTYLPLFKKRGSGNLIFIGSEAALQGKRKATLYCASKFALRGFTQALREECAASGVRVCLINPGMVLSSFFASQTFRPGEKDDEAMIPEDIAQIISMLLKVRSGTVFDEINLSPQKRKVLFDPSVN